MIISSIEFKEFFRIVITITYIPSRLIIVESILRIAVLMVLGGGNLVMPILIELDRLGSNTISSLFFVAS